MNFQLRLMAMAILCLGGFVAAADRESSNAPKVNLATVPAGALTAAGGAVPLTLICVDAGCTENDTDARRW